ncbi:PAS domain S-box-containing protein/diguanylate cyclase (GGDEF) domain-containing protein [Geodermatophilus obscurus]|uniref:PAS domain S-box-containing protein/diguanylate cyclase (GGDEF) domain-containing protein n=1 Tax=Geodermatophilus obscurus TaxID=1861 RepID=A0A1M7SM45_9ACTN|nr:GGDEF domain-containing protein [Geodermatophilus obscurus]SHN59559.1 PAS domain S-box-containing protein/diguanylate cyclase (GGDEF) domain-containing protein [Geodermatophilus obscurus]
MSGGHLASSHAAALHSAFLHAPMGMAVTTVDGVLAEVNLALCRLLGRTPEALPGTSLFDLTHPDDRDGARRSCAALRVHRSSLWRHECRFLRTDGEPVAVQVATSWVDADGGRTAHLVMIIEDIGDRKAVEAGLRHQAVHDPLTGLPNRVLFRDRLQHALDRGHREGTETCVLMIDLDGFKAINDRYGHPAGDRVLAAFAGRLTAALRASDTAARLGGDEFAVICERSAPYDAQALVRRLHTLLVEPFDLDGRPVPVRCSIGLGHVHGGTDASAGAATLIGDADRRMYADKRRRRD